MKKILLISFTICLIIIFLVFYIFFYPHLKLNKGNIIMLNYNDNYIEYGTTVSYRGKEYKNIAKIEGRVNSNRLGTYRIVYTAKKGLFTVRKIRIVKVIDNISPKLILHGSEKIVKCPTKIYQEVGYHAYDEYDNDLTSKVKTIFTNDSVTYLVADSSYNFFIKKRQIINDDITPPVITLNGESNVYLPVNSSYNESGYEAIDNCDDDITNKVIVEGNVNSNNIGEYSINYTATDSHNNTTTVTRNIHVYSPQSCISASHSGIPATIYLTFDDGPNWNNTPTILDILRDEGIKATFFIIDRYGTDDLIRRIVAEGHTIALHSTSHNYYDIYSSIYNFFNDLEAIQNKIYNITGEKTYIMRFPGGSSNTISSFNRGIMCTLSNEVISRGYHYFDWNVSSGDAGGAYSSSQVYNNVVNSLNIGRPNVVLMHDFSNYTKDALRDIIRYGKSNGYTFKNITMDTEMIRHRINN